MDQVPAASVEDVPNPFNKHASQRNWIWSLFSIVHCVHLRIHSRICLWKRNEKKLNMMMLTCIKFLSLSYYIIVTKWKFNSSLFWRNVQAHQYCRRQIFRLSFFLCPHTRVEYLLLSFRKWLNWIFIWNNFLGCALNFMSNHHRPYFSVHKDWWFSRKNQFLIMNVRMSCIPYALCWCGHCLRF